MTDGPPNSYDYRHPYRESAPYRGLSLLEHRTRFLALEIHPRVDPGADRHGSVRVGGESRGLRPRRQRRIDFHLERLLLGDQDAVDFRELVNAGRAGASGIRQAESLMLAGHAV